MATAPGAARSPLFSDLPAVFSLPGWANLPEARAERDYTALLLEAFSSVFLAPASGFDTTSGTQATSKAKRGPLEQYIRYLPLVANPAGKNSEFLDWLGEWVALSDRIELPRHKKENLIANALRLYRVRGTKRYLEEMLAYYLDCGATVDEPDLPSVQIGRTSTVGRDTYIGGTPPYFFRVTLIASPGAREDYAHLLYLARAVIDLSKPAHTWYDLRIDAPAMQIGTHSTIGVDTLLVAPVAGGKE